MTVINNNKPDIVDVAKAARVSISTVSRSFNHPDLVNPTTRRRIERAVKKLGYIRNRAAQVMHGKRSGTIGLVVPTIDNAIFAELIQSFTTELDVRGFTMLIASHGFDLDREYAMLRKLLEHRVDGLAVIGLEHSDATHHLVEEQGIPIVAIWNYSETTTMPCVGVENAEAGRLAARHLLSLGHQKISLVFPSTVGNDRAYDRFQGALNELRSKDVDVPENWILEAPYSIAEAKRACLSLLKADNIPTAILCGNDIIAQGALYAAQKSSIDVPADLSVMGIGDFKGSGEIEPSLSTIRIPAKNIGSLAAKHITDKIADKHADLVKEKCELRIIERSSTARTFNTRARGF